MIITDEAKAVLSGILTKAKEATPDVDLHVRIETRTSLTFPFRGCIGVRYAVFLNYEKKDADIVETDGDIEIRIDPVSWRLVKTCTISTTAYGEFEVLQINQDPAVTDCYCGNDHAAEL